jgi:hypothetical protein
MLRAKSPVLTVVSLQPAEIALQAVVNHVTKLLATMAALLGQLPHAVSFRNPAFEPHPLSYEGKDRTEPHKRRLARRASPALLARAGLSMTERPIRPTLPTVLFVSPFSAPELLSSELLISSLLARKKTTLFRHYAHCEERAADFRRRRSNL